MVKGKEETNKTNTEQRNIDDHAAIDMTTMQWTPWPVSPAFIQQLAKDLIEWASDDEIDAIRMTDFSRSKGMYTKDFWRLVQKYPLLAEAYEEAKILVGSRRECGAIRKRYDSGAIRWGQHWYGEEWKGYDKFHADLKKMEAIQDTILNAIYNKAPESDKVNAKIAEIKAKKKGKK